MRTAGRSMGAAWGVALGVAATAISAALVSPAAAGTVTLHQVYAPGDCTPPQVETIDVPSGRLSLREHIKNWSAGAYAGIPKWMAFQRYEPEANGWTGWGATVGIAGGDNRVRGVSSKTTPQSPVAGGVLDYEEEDDILVPFRMQVQIAGPTWHSGDGACHQGPMETSLTITVGGGLSGAVPPDYSGQWTSTQGTMSLNQSGASVTGSYNGDSGSRILGQAQGASFDGFWTETSTRYRCKTEEGGSWYWGRLQWTLSADGKHLGGEWGYCDATPNSPWSGDRTSGPTGQPANPTGFQPTSVAADPFGDRLDVSEVDGQWLGTWIRRPGTNIFDAHWHGQNGGDVTDVIRLQSVNGDQATFSRDGNGGTYTATLGPDGHSLRGTASWYQPDWTWTAQFGGSGSQAGVQMTYTAPAGPTEDRGSTGAYPPNPPVGQENGGYPSGDHGGPGPVSHGWGHAATPPADQTLADNWNTAACDVTDTATLDLARPTHLSRIDLWFHWNAGEQSVGYRMASGGADVGGGTLQRAECDPYQTAWCVARDTPGADLAAGRYEIRTERVGVCRNGGSGGAGFLKAFGYETGGAGR